MTESILITGATIGLGKETARQLALKKENNKGNSVLQKSSEGRGSKKTLSRNRGEDIRNHYWRIR